MRDMQDMELMEGGGEESPRMRALERLLEFIAQSETKRVSPQEAAPMEVPEEELDESVLDGLGNLKDFDEDGE